MDIRKNLLPEIHAIIAASKEAAIRSVDYQRVRMYWTLGQKIFKEEQDGKVRAGYGEMLVKTLAAALEPHDAKDISKDPMVLKFPGLKREAA